MQTIRVWFVKRDEACYISHLDLQRVVQRALKRAGVPVWYTQGFNPHIYLTFALPLPLGQQSITESFDFKTEQDRPDIDAIYWQLNRALPRGIEVFAVTRPEMGSGKIAWARYLIRFEGDGESIRKKAEAFFSRPQLLVDKRTKRGGIKQLDLLPYLQKRDWLPFTQGACLDLTLPAGSTLNINPDLILSALEQATGIDPLDASICRTQLLTETFEKFR